MLVEWKEYFSRLAKMEKCYLNSVQNENDKCYFSLGPFLAIKITNASLKSFPRVV